MAFTIVPNSVAPGSMVTARLRYTGQVPPVPDDVHIDAQQDDGSWRAVTGYDHIPAGMDPVTGFDLPFSAGNPNVGGVGHRMLRVRWTRGGQDIGTPEQTWLDIVDETAEAEAPEETWWPRSWLCKNDIDCRKLFKAIAAAIKAMGKDKGFPR